MAATDSSKNMAAFLDKPGTPFAVREAPMPTPAAHELVLRVHSVAINPTDYFRAAQGRDVPEDSYPYVIGCDGAGVVHSVGNDVGHFNVGDRTMAMSTEFFVHKADHGMFQRYVVIDGRHACKIPDRLSFDEACVSPLAMATAAGALFEKESMDLNWPRLAGTSEFGEQQKTHANDVVVVWGGSSSVGCCAIQMLKAAGYRVVATASKRNFDLCTQAGAEAVFDYNDEECIDRVCKWVEQRGLQSAGAFPVVIDPSSFEKCAAIAKRLPGRKYVTTTLPRGLLPKPNLGEGIGVGDCLVLQQADLLEHLWSKYMPDALRSGELKCLPPAEFVGRGLESVQGACDLMSKGVSGKKLVVSGI
ncbi:hypothetical protein LTR05_006861 [Lithohypha guttulata]|uniref:Enoyl reductase (ER) domain-containing protein n=1 Tax=Lithohypha guttulata TaxID=1690604 RepID=A0AAN7SVY2_9EURO|nr:hypothetical protein LTR05_006861 [Lithohypha guttulata]